MPIRQSSSTVQPCTTARCPIETSDPDRDREVRVRVQDGAVLHVAAGPTRIAAPSPRTTAPNQMLAPASTVTSPTRVAPSATNASGATAG